MTPLYHTATGAVHPSLYPSHFTKKESAKFLSRTFLRLSILFAFMTAGAASQAQAPPGFVEEQVGDEWNAAVGLTFSEDGEDMFVWEKGGKVWVVSDGEKAENPLIDLTNEVGDWGDHGLLGFTLDPDFKDNGYIYLLYVVDRHYLLTGGTGSYNPSVTSENEATIGRVTRYKVTTQNGAMAADLSSRKVLLGETKSTGIPILYVSHGVGSLAFGEDGSLLISVGDGATANDKDIGWKEGVATDNFVEQALQDGILAQVNNVGAFRSQQTNSLNGKILRINPETGDGLPSNPFYDAAKPRADQSRVWALGLRNPFRFSVRPGTGSSTNPGVLYIGDVGWQDWEEINVSTQGGLNFGWPLYEGLEKQNFYFYTGVPTPDLLNPLFNTGGCDRKTFYFQELLVPPTKNGQAYFGNYCDWQNTPIPDNIPKFVHTRPAIDWANAATTDATPPVPATRTGTFDSEGNATVINVGAPGSPVSGEPFYGSSSTGGIWYTGNDLPAEYKNTYFFGDYGAGWIKVMTFDGNNKPTAVRNFIGEGATVTAFAANPATGGLYYINYGAQIRKISYYNGNTPPKAVASADKRYGASPLTVNFTGSKSTDTEGALTYEWDFGDGSATVAEANPTHVFRSENVESYTVKLKVTDADGLSSSTKLHITLNNTPPVAKIVSPANGALYPMDKLSTYDLRAEVTDAEDQDEQLTYEWQVSLHHNTHSHPEPVINEHETSATIAAIGCDGATYFYRFSLKVIDSGGLSTTDYVDIYPDCSGGIVEAVAVASPADSSTFEVGAPIVLSVDFADEARDWAKVEYFVNGASVSGVITAAPYTFTWNKAPAGTYNITAKATDADGHSMQSEAVMVVVGDGGLADLTNCLPGLVHYFGLDEEEGMLFSDYASTTKATCENCPEAAEGKFKKAQHFNGTDAGVDIKDISKFNWNASDNFSIEFWFKTEESTAENAVIVGRDNTGLHWWIGLNPQGQAMFMLRDVAHAGILLGEKGPALNDGNWHSLVAVRDGASNMNRLFIDGELLHEQQYQYSNNFVGDAPVNVGYLNLGGGYRYNGDLDELKVYDRALTATEVTEQFNGGEGAYCGPSALGITDNETFAGKFEVFPNPTEGKKLNIFVSMLSPNEHVRFVLTDLTGKTVLEHKATTRPDGTVQLTLYPKKGLSSGLYNLLLYSKERQLYRKVLVSQ